MPDILGQRSSKIVVASADYSAVDPTVVILQKGAGTGLAVTVTPTAQTGAGNTVTLTARDADTAATIGSPLVITAAAAGTLILVLPTTIHRVSLTPVGTGTRTTLVYSISAVWADVTYAPGFYWDGVKYATSEGQTP